MELTDVVRQLSLADDIDTLRPGWDASQRSRPAGDVTFLAPDFAAEVCRDLGLPEEVAQAASAAVAASPAMPLWGPWRGTTTTGYSSLRASLTSMISASGPPSGKR